MRWPGLMVPVGVGPAVVGALARDVKFLRRQLGALLGRVEVRIQVVQLIAAVHHEVQLAGLRVPVQRHDVARAGDEALAVRERLAGLVGIEAPDAGMLLEQGAGLLAGRALRPILLLAGVRGCSDVDVEVARIIDGNSLGGMAALLRKALDHRLRRAIGRQIVLRQRIAVDRLVARGVEKAVVDREARAGVLAEVHAVIDGAVAVLVAQRHDAAVFLRLAQRHEDVAVVAHRDVPRPADAIGEDFCVETLGHADAGVLVDRARLVQAELLRLAERGAGEGQRPEHGARQERGLAAGRADQGRLAGHDMSGLPIVAHVPSAARSPVRTRTGVPPYDLDLRWRMARRRVLARLTRIAAIG